MIMSWWHHTHPGLARGSGHLVFGSGQPIRAEKTCVTCGARLCAWPATPPARDGCFRRPISTRVSPVDSSLPPLHSGMVKTQFWQLLFLSKNQTLLKPSALIPIVGGIQLSHARTGGVLIVAQRRLSTLWHNILRGSAKPPTSTGEVHFIRDRERIQNKYMEEEDHFTLLYSQLSHTAAYSSRATAHGNSSSFSLILSLYSHHTLTSLLHSQSLTFCSLSRCPFIGNNGAIAPALLQQRWLPTPSFLQQWWLPKSMVGAVHLLHINGNKPNSFYLCFLPGFFWFSLIPLVCSLFQFFPLYFLVFSSNNSSGCWKWSFWSCRRRRRQGRPFSFSLMFVLSLCFSLQSLLCHPLFLSLSFFLINSSIKLLIWLIKLIQNLIKSHNFHLYYR